MTIPPQHLQPELSDERLIRILEIDCKYPDIQNACEKCEFWTKSGMRKGCCDFGMSDAWRIFVNSSGH